VGDVGLQHWHVADVAELKKASSSPLSLSKVPYGKTRKNGHGM
jgi:hypothetical protein